ncbi:unnamed protein product [Notodromas monacha]|uniref:Zinc finger C2HC domain-containing protein 1A n=1 Tax=Notodromas monacha TaxID=399045 RepID=A0A7R9GFZ0_9CRUS|nr:unnamed protein product [Notodromas monacha]CAG0921167.1 unnamed protein product [Notodromas monacha]
MTMYEALDIGAHDDAAQALLELEPCPYCNRKFNKLSRHAKVCKKVSKKSRPVFDSAKQRLSGISEQDKCLVNPVSPVPLKVEAPKDVPLSQLPQERIWNRTKSYVMGLKDRFINPKAKTRSNRISLENEPPRAKSEAAVIGRVPVNYVQCPSCDRWFGPKAADRHIDWCTSKLFHVPAGNVPSVVEKKRWENRVNYKAPIPGKARLETRQKFGYSPNPLRIARGFSPPKPESGLFERTGPRRTSLRGRRFGESEDPLAYALGRQELPPKKQPVRRFLSSSAYRAEPDGIDQAALAKSMKIIRRISSLLCCTCNMSMRSRSKGKSGVLRKKMSRTKIHPSSDPHPAVAAQQVMDKMSTVEEEEEEEVQAEVKVNSSLNKSSKPQRTLKSSLKARRNRSESGISSSSSSSSSRSSKERKGVQTCDASVQVAMVGPAWKSMPELAKIGPFIVATLTRDGYEVHRSLLHENAARQLEELLMSSSTTSLGDLSLPGTPLMSRSLGSDSFGFRPSSGRSKIPRRSPSPVTQASDEFLLNELMASDLLSLPTTKNGMRKSTCPPPSLQEMLYGGIKNGSNQPTEKEPKSDDIFDSSGPFSTAITNFDLPKERKSEEVPQDIGLSKTETGFNPAPIKHFSDLPNRESKPKFESRLFPLSTTKTPKLLSGMLNRNNARILGKSGSGESDDDVISASHSVVTNIASEMGSLALFDTPTQNSSVTGATMPHFCHECGAKYPVSSAKFCCNCGTRRSCLNKFQMNEEQSTDAGVLKALKSNPSIDCASREMCVLEPELVPTCILRLIDPPIASRSRIEVVEKIPFPALTVCPDYHYKFNKTVVQAHGLNISRSEDMVNNVDIWRNFSWDTVSLQDFWIQATSGPRDLVLRVMLNNTSIYVGAAGNEYLDPSNEMTPIIGKLTENKGGIKPGHYVTECRACGKVQIGNSVSGYQGEQKALPPPRGRRLMLSLPADSGLPRVTRGSRDGRSPSRSKSPDSRLSSPGQARGQGKGQRGKGRKGARSPSSSHSVHTDRSIHVQFTSKEQLDGLQIKGIKEVTGNELGNDC